MERNGVFAWRHRWARRVRRCARFRRAQRGWLGPVGLEADVAGGRQLQLLLAKQEVELIASCLQQADVGRALRPGARRRLLPCGKTIRVGRTRRWNRARFGGCCCLRTRPRRSPCRLRGGLFHDGEVRDGGLISAAGVAVHLDRASHLAEADDAHLRTSEVDAAWSGGLGGKRAEKKQGRDAGGCDGCRECRHVRLLFELRRVAAKCKRPGRF